jgi:pilus assembly protein Flp/PilA
MKPAATQGSRTMLVHRVFLMASILAGELTMSKIRALLRDERGASMVEYSILIGIITATVIATIVLIGGKIGTAWTTLNNAWQ